MPRLRRPAPGFVRVLDKRTLAFPLYDGNGMYLTAGRDQTRVSTWVGEVVAPISYQSKFSPRFGSGGGAFT